MPANTALDPVALTQALVRCASVTPHDAGALDVRPSPRPPNAACGRSADGVEVKVEPKMILPAHHERREGLPVPIERRRKPSGATMAKQGFLRASGGQDARNERPSRRHGQPRAHLKEA